MTPQTNIDMDLPVVRAEGFAIDAALTIKLQEVWRQLPDHVQTDLTDRFEAFTRTRDGSVLGHAKPMDSEGSYFEVCLYTNNLNRYDDDAVRYVIAHELAHVFANHIRPPVAEDEFDEHYAPDEREADSLAASWGFLAPAQLARRFD